MTPAAERPTVDRESRRDTVVLVGGTVAALLILGEVLPRTGIVSRVVFPTPGDVVSAFGRLIAGGYWFEDLRLTLVAVLIAWLIGSTIGVVVGIVMGVSPYTRRVVSPYAIAIQSLPKIVLAPLLIGWLGFGTNSKIAIAVAICFFPVWVDTMVGLSLPDEEQFQLMRSLRASRWQVFRMLQLPTAVPMILVGIKHAMLLAFTGVLVAEILAVAGGGLGTLAEEFAKQLLMAMTFAIVTVVIVLAVTLVSILDVVERRLVFWSASNRNEGR